jgi:hypothetical protein
VSAVCSYTQLQLAFRGTTILSCLSFSLSRGAVGPVTADWESVSTIRLRGTFRTDEGFEAELTEWKSEIAGGANNMTGRFTIAARFTNFWGPQVIVKQCEIVTLARVAR